MVTVRVGAAVLVASLAAGCVQPVSYQPAGPIQLQPYPPPVTYQSVPDYRPPLAGPVQLQSPPPVDPLPAPAQTPASDTASSDTSGAIPLQDMPAPATDSPADAPAAPAAAPAPSVQKIPATAGGGSSVPLEGFRPMRGQTRPAP